MGVEKVNKVELTAALARHTGITKVDAEVMVNATFKIIADRDRKSVV